MSARPVNVGFLSRRPQVRIAGELMELSEHAAERYFERVRPGLASLHAAIEDFRMVVQACATVVDSRPEWCDAEEPAERWLLVGDSIVLPVSMIGRLPLIVTCMVRGYPTGDALTERRRRRSARKRHASRNRNGGREGGRPYTRRDTDR